MSVVRRLLFAKLMKKYSLGGSQVGQKRRIPETRERDNYEKNNNKISVCVCCL